jgi:hypothetical protein
MCKGPVVACVNAWPSLTWRTEKTLNSEGEFLNFKVLMALNKIMVF